MAMPEQEWKDWGEAKNEFGISELKRALVEVQKICASYDHCEGCPFGFDHYTMHICRLSPIIGSQVIPTIWKLDDRKEK